MTPRSVHKDKLHGLYVITDENLISEDNFENAIESALRGGARIIQYRDKSGNLEKRHKQARALHALCQKYQATSIINDDIELAKAVNADGVHLGKNDADLSSARQTLGNDAIIGVSCYNDISLALHAEENQADYIAFGAIFSSSTKPDAVVAGLGIIAKARQQLNLPICTIGGITEKNIQQVIQRGATMTAVISSVFSAKDIKQTTINLNQYF
ncbi:MAG: thiamine phosphate synthase [Gammaproteobacteria bacterium]|nr:thiamine phosphate synthase [Gammaproteobacteria bacterium]